MNRPRLLALVVEDDRSWQQILSEILSDSGLEVDVTGNLEEAILALKAQPHRLAVVDLSLAPNDHNNQDGLRVLDAVKRLDPNCQTILLTGYATVELAVTAITEYNAYTFLRKENFHRGQFREIIYRVLASSPQSNNPGVPSLSQTEGKTLFASSTSLSKPDNTAGRAIVVEDDAGWRSIIEELLVDANFQVRTCNSFGEALGYLLREKFSLAVVDLSLNGTISGFWEQKTNSDNLEGYQLLTNTRAAGIPTIIVSGVASPYDIRRTYSEQSIFAFLEKQTFDTKIFQRIVEEARITHAYTSELGILTEREREVLELLSKGLTNKEIAEKLFITTNTVKRHLKAIFEKLNVHTRSAAAAKALGDK